MKHEVDIGYIVSVLLPGGPTQVYAGSMSIEGPACRDRLYEALMVELLGRSASIEAVGTFYNDDLVKRVLTDGIDTPIDMYVAGLVMHDGTTVRVLMQYVERLVWV